MYAEVQQQTPELNNNSFLHCQSGRKPSFVACLELWVTKNVGWLLIMCLLDRGHVSEVMNNTWATHCKNIAGILINLALHFTFWMFLLLCVHMENIKFPLKLLDWLKSNTQNRKYSTLKSNRKLMTMMMDLMYWWPFLQSKWNTF